MKTQICLKMISSFYRGYHPETRGRVLMEVMVSMTLWDSKLRCGKNQ